MQERQPGFRETITESAEAEGRFVRQSGGRGQYAVVRLRVEPLEAGEDILFVNALADDRLPYEYIQPIEDGVREAAETGILAGYPIIGVQVTLLDGKYHPTDSSAMAFKTAGSMAFKEAGRKAHLVLLEAIMLVEVTTPLELFDQVIGDLNRMRGWVVVTEESGDRQIIRANVPQSDLLGYEAELRYHTKGQASVSMQFSHYAKFPPYQV